MSRTDHVTRIAGHFERAILSGRLEPGDLLPSERDISEQMGVSRSVVREALGRLASLGLVSSRHGSGTRVAEPSTRPVTLGYRRLLARPGVRWQDLAAVRLPLETAIAAQAAAHRTAEHLERLARAQAVLGDSERPLEQHIRADLDFHAALADATYNPLFCTVLAPIQELLIESRRRTLGRYGAALAHEHHAVILAAVEAGDSAAAAEAMRRHLEANLEQLGTLDAGPAE
jgi:GntR family transcriptional repressor for pyruvate dehydrogenase complex